ncbi:Methyl-CpG-binding domain protein 2 [Cichlidogyrus casuarinus]|uniref:Methyl-CpG-binding domain protein 2 n=1 Tax=Cichlidogyrus casuarinus TaxID=1844966 RepID=A0ABD2PYS3_9PLAT
MKWYVYINKLRLTLQLVKNLTPYSRMKPCTHMVEPKVVRKYEQCNEKTASKKVCSTTLEKPHQLFWEKRFKDLIIVDANTGEKLPPPKLPENIQNAGFIGINDEHILLSLIDSLTSKTNLISGQNAQQAVIEKNPCIAIQPNQPLIKGYIVTDDDIKQQELKVREIRNKLQMARKRLNQFYTIETEG